ncbi:hypothetical protein FVQ98_18790 [Ottowia sp. GY511]|uniref:DUF6683 family protein n=1 Tax=Ottowia flava TaxID=2675430 RepID=A0ABW4KU36_9BURK|nr:DUF6683 family protein [Ottowia sp. GY511]TXK21981.1 hypothetical protein FVQ98_18790 [Ottowia sp. GY511]
MKVVSAFFLALSLAASQAHAWTSEGFTIDFNEQWLRQDAYNRAMTQAKKDMKPGTSTAKSSGRSVKTDILWTGAQRVVNGRFIDEQAIDEMAQRFPPEQRKQARQALTQIVGSFNDNVEKLYGVPKENVATGVVALLAGGYAAYYNKPFPDKYVKPTVEQVAAYLRSKPELFEGKTTEKRNSYQKGVGVGMLLQMLQQEVQKSGKASDAAELKQVGARVYRAVLSVEPDNVEFTSTGIKFR